MNVKLIAIAGLLAVGTNSGAATAVLDMQLDGYIGTAEASIAACKKIAPVGTKKLEVAIARAVLQEKQTLEALRKMPGYAKEFKKEADRWHYMTDKGRTASCKKLDEAQYP
jgi:hypothetical protein